MKRLEKQPALLKQFEQLLCIVEDSAGDIQKVSKAEIKSSRNVGYQTAESKRYHKRGTVKRMNTRLKDEFGGHVVRIRGHTKVMCHFIFGILALTANQMMCFLE